MSKTDHPSLDKSLTYLALGGVLLLATVLHFWGLDQEGLNQYYAATVKSMLTSWHNFFFAAFDPGGFVSVDKPPLGFWIQCASAAIFGVNSFGLLLPQALAGVLAVALLYHLVARVFGAWAGIIAALVLAVTPISIAANRNNTMDAQLVLTSLLAAWAVSIATEKGKLRWLIACAIFVGIGFNIKMLQAVMVLPAFWLVFLIAARTEWWKRIVHLVIASMILGIVSFAWIVVFDATPADERPFAGSSRNNSMMELVSGHNGLTRLGQMASWLGLRGPAPQQARAAQPPPNIPPQGQPGQPPMARNQPPAPGNQPPPNQPQPPRNGPNDETGAPGILRLFNQQLAGQISWLLPLSILGCIAAAFATRFAFPLAREHQQLFLWFAWLAPQVVFFSFAGLFHRYYLEMLSPAIAALVGIGIVALWRIYTTHRWRGMILPLALLIGAITQVLILTHFADWSRWLTPMIIGLTIVGVSGLIVSKIKPALTFLPLTFCLLTLLIAPTIWSLTPVVGGADIGLPFAGPELLARPRSGTVARDTRLTDYLLANRNGAQFIAATTSANTAAPIILATGEPVMAIGGFSGSDNILTLDQFKQMVGDNTVRLFVLQTQNNQPGDIARWVTTSCANVTSAIRANAPRNAPAQNPGGEQLVYDCGVKK